MRQHTCPTSERDEFVHQWTENCIDTVKSRISRGTTSTPPLLKGCGGNNLSHVYRSLKIEKQKQKKSHLDLLQPLRLKFNHASENDRRRDLKRLTR